MIRQSRVAQFERDRAQRRFNEVRRLAHSVIFDLQPKIAGLPGSTPVRRELIASAIGYVDQLAKEATGDPGLQHELAESYVQIGEIQGGGNTNLGDRQGALASFQKAEQIARALVAAHPSFGARQLLLSTMRDVGRVYFESNDRGRSEAYRKQTLAMARDLRKQYPGNEDAKIMLAICLFDLATASVNSQTLAYELEALPIDDEMLSAKPSDPKRQRNVAIINKSIAGYWLGFDALRALPYLQRALAVDEQRLAKDPGDQGIKLDLSFDYSQFGQYYSAKGELPTAIRYQRKTLAIRRDLAASDPKDVWKQERLAWTLTNIAYLLIQTHDYRAALASVDESRRILEPQGLSKTGTMTDYASALIAEGEANRGIGNEAAACAQFSKARDLYDKLGYSRSTLAWLNKDLPPCARQ